MVEPLGWFRLYQICILAWVPLDWIVVLCQVPPLLSATDERLGLPAPGVQPRARISVLPDVTVIAGKARDATLLAAVVVCWTKASGGIGVGVAVGVAVGVGVGGGVAAGVGVGVGVGTVVRVGEGSGDGVALGVGLGDGVGVAVGVELQVSEKVSITVPSYFTNERS
jgi:hypothetical protein